MANRFYREEDRPNLHGYMEFDCCGKSHSIESNEALSHLAHSHSIFEPRADILIRECSHTAMETIEIWTCPWGCEGTFEGKLMIIKHLNARHSLLLGPAKFLAEAIQHAGEG